MKKEEKGKTYVVDF